MIKFLGGLAAGVIVGGGAGLFGASLGVALTIGIVVAIVCWGGWVLIVDGDWDWFN